MLSDSGSGLFFQLFGVLAFHVGTGDVSASAAGIFDDEDGRLALRAVLSHGPVPNREITVGILVAGIEDLSALRAFFYQ